MIETLFDKFDIKEPEKIEDYNLIGIDFGDGELSAAYVDENKLTGKRTVKSLALNENGVTLKERNAFHINADKIKLLASLVSLHAQKGVCYYNYKTCLIDERIDTKYVMDDCSYADLTYRQVMQKCFSELVNSLFKWNEYLDKEKPTIIMVGCPSSEGWKKSQKEYAKMLREGLELPKGQKPIYIAIQSESTAAMARELDPQLEEQRIRENEVVVVLDNGSSTFDITVISPSKGVVGEASYQFGGNKLDEILLKLFERQLDKQHNGVMLETMHGVKLELRSAKERYYGGDGTGKVEQLYSKRLENGETFRFILDHNVMKNALECEPTCAFGFELGLDGLPYKTSKRQYASWLDACRSIYTDFYKRMKDKFYKEGTDPSHPVIPHRIILSGGVSLMPEVQQIVEEVFGIKPVVTERPNYSVSMGLGYILGVEVKKRQLLKELLQELQNILPSVTDLRNMILDEGEMEEWKAFKETFEFWAGSEKNYTVNDLEELWEKDFFKKEVQGVIQRAVNQWYEKNEVNRKITQSLQNKFKELFSSYEKQFKYEMPEIDFGKLSEECPEMAFDYSVFCGQNLMNEQARQLPRNKEYRKNAYQNFLNSEEIIKHGGKTEILVEIPVRYGVLGKKVKLEKRLLLKEYQGIRPTYGSVISEQYAEKIRNEIKLLLKEPLMDYIEYITPYFQMTAHQHLDSKD